MGPKYDVNSRRENINNCKRAVWVPLAPTGLLDPGSGGSEKWEVLVGAPGYAIAHAVYCYKPAPNAVFGGVPGSARYSLNGCAEIVRG